MSLSEKTSLDADLILSSYSTIKLQADDFAESFYQILFDKYPKLQPLFLKTDMNKQKGKLMESLDLVLVNVNNPKAFNSILKDLGRRHVKYGAVLTDYPLVGDALFQALEKHLGKDWSPDVKNAWVLAYQAIADTMAEGAKSDQKSDLQAAVALEKNNISNSQNSSSKRKRSSNKIIGIMCIGIALFSGCAIWTLMQTPANIAPNPARESSNN